ncbi:MAG: HAD family hydrolase [Candidatus Brocadiia bacterium]
MTLAIFDLDETIIRGDTDALWGEYLIERGLLDRKEWQANFDRFMSDYLKGTLVIGEAIRYYASVIGKHPIPAMKRHAHEFARKIILPRTKPKVLAEISDHRRGGREIVIITATNSFLSRPVAAELGIKNLLCTDMEEIGGKPTGSIAGTPCFRNGKVARLRAWVAANGKTLDGSWFYSDSHNDLPLMELVARPVAVDPDAELRSVAQSRGWKIMDTEAR